MLSKKMVNTEWKEKRVSKRRQEMIWKTSDQLLALHISYRSLLSAMH